MYDFDTVIDRSNTDAVKLELCSAVFGTSDITPMWVADMDFPCPQPIIMTLRERMEHPIYGYTIRTPRFAQSIRVWNKRRNGWDINANSIEWCPGVVPSLSISILAFSQPGDGVIIQPPVYPPFFDVVINNGRTLLQNPLVVEDGEYKVNFEEFEKLASQPSTKIFMLCHPHNPVGREWTEEELRKMAEICIKNDVLILSDEIHSDIMLFGKKHKPMASLSEEIAQHTLTFMAASKTFNIAGLSTSYMIAPNAELRNKYKAMQQALHLESSMLGPLALQAAYENCEPWLNELQTYISDNVTFAIDFINRYMPEVKIIKPQATYLMWLDFSAYGISHKDLKFIIYNRAHLGINDGTTFGISTHVSSQEENTAKKAPDDYECFFRLNVASPQSILEEALNNLYKVFETLKK
ncbi:MAG: pyridoxal phosphate-dependent aminotransferase [Bacteroidales bacterium]|nr:pyridoxal phosphate-dependent aminotransferase [Bacteroidales bacterium]